MVNCGDAPDIPLLDGALERNEATPRLITGMGLIVPPNDVDGTLGSFGTDEIALVLPGPIVESSEHRIVVCFD